MANGNDASGRYPTRAVIDTNVIINLALGDHDRGLPQDASRRSKRLVDDGLGGKYELLVPSMVLVELFSNHELRSNRDGVSSEYIQNCHRRICEWCIDADFLTIDLNEDAADWIHDHPHLQDIRPGDAAILASAWFAGAPVIYSWDAKFARCVQRANELEPLGIVVREPPELPAPDLLDMIEESREPLDGGNECEA